MPICRTHVKQHLMEKDELIQIVQECLGRVYTNDANLLDINIHENAVNGRFSKYLADYVEQDEITVDVEYNRHIDQLKTYGIYGDSAIVDIVIHQRLTDSNNIVALECKKRTINETDIRKIRALVDDEFNYQYGITVEYYNGLVTLCQKLDGEILTEIIEL